MPKPIQDSLEKFIINDGQSIKEKESTIINGVIINALWGAMLISAAFPSMTAAPSNKKRKIHKGRDTLWFLRFL